MVDIINLITTDIKDKFISLINSENNEKIKYTRKYLEFRLNKFFKKEKRFKKNWLALYYGFTKTTSAILPTPYYISLFYSNLNYITSSCVNSEWDVIMDIYKKIVKKNPNYKNARLDEEKPIYDRRYILVIVYYIFIIFVYVISQMLYKKISETFNTIIDFFGIRNQENSTFILFIAYVLFILGLYYGGIEFIILCIKILIQVIYYLSIFIYYLVYYLGWLLLIIFKLLGKVMYKTKDAMIGGSKNNNKKIIGGDIFEDIEDYINNVKTAFDKLSVDFIVSILDSFFNSIIPEDNILESQCKSTSNIEKMLSRHNSRRNTEEPININEKVTDITKKFLPNTIKKDPFVKCMIKKKPKPITSSEKCED